MNQEINKIIKTEIIESTIKSNLNTLKNIEVIDPEIVSNQIKEIDKRVEEVCPSHDNSEQSEIDLEVFIGMERQIKDLQKKNKIATDALKLALAFIIHDNLRLSIENALKELKK